MITDADVKKLKKVFATKDDLKALSNKFETKFATKDEMSSGFVEIINFIGETKDEIIKEFHDFRDEMRNITRTHQSSLDNHEARIAHLEYNKA